MRCSPTLCPQSAAILADDLAMPPWISTATFCWLADPTISAAHTGRMFGVHLMGVCWMSYSCTALTASLGVFLQLHGLCLSTLPCGDVPARPVRVDICPLLFT